jgi:hypothetical protein
MAGFFVMIVVPIWSLISSGHIRRNIKRTLISPRKGTSQHSYQTFCPRSRTPQSSVNCQSYNQAVVRELGRRAQTLHVSEPFPTCLSSFLSTRIPLTRTPRRTKWVGQSARCIETCRECHLHRQKYVLQSGGTTDHRPLL